MITPVDTVEYYQDIIDYISEKVGQPVEMEYRKTYDERDRLLENGSVDAAFICGAPYVDDKKQFGAELPVAPQVDGSPFYRSFIIVHRDSDIQSFDDLKGRSFAFTDPKSNSGKLYPTENFIPPIFWQGTVRRLMIILETTYTATAIINQSNSSPKRRWTERLSKASSTST
jgi:ABC-type phosphate/phosphonate transport system substrate-binding protein